MKAATTILEQAVSNEKSWVAIYADLFKARLTFLVLLATLAGFCVGSHGLLDYTLMLDTVLGTALVAAGASALNQLWERDYDAKMRRTRDRPLPSGRLQPQTVLLVGSTAAAVGLAYLALAVTLTASLVAAGSLVSYLFIYTPLKRVTWLNTAVGAVPGGLPPLIGWTAAQGRFSVEGLVLVGILGLWQIPHFMSIAWLYRDEYARAGFKMLPVVDPEGRRTGRHACACAAALLAVSVCPVWLGLAGRLYGASAVVLGLGFLWLALRFSRELTPVRARQLFLASVLYLPLLLAIMVVNKMN